MTDDGAPAPAPRTPRLTPQAVATAAECPRRLWLNQQRPGGGTPPPEHILMLRERANAHEREVAARFANRHGPVWRREGSFADAAAETLRLLRTTRDPIDQPVFLSPDGRRSAAPDLVYWDGDRLVVLDARLALRPDARSDFALQLAHARAVIRESAGLDPVRFEVVNGRGETIVVRPAPESEHAAALAAAEGVFARETEPDLLRGHSSCKPCQWYSHCWDLAQAERRIEVLPEVQSAHVPLWHALGVRTLDALASFDPARAPRDLPHGAAKRAIVAAAAWRDDRAVWLHPVRLPAWPVVWFDLEGDARGEDAEVPIYLWGFALDDGVNASRGEAIVAGLEDGGDRAAWTRFVARATAILDAHPDVRWVHWDQYETLWIQRYTARHGAPAGFAERFTAACFDLKRVLDRCVRLPLRSYSIKHVARWTGFAWRDPDSGSEWSTARFHRACQTDDPAEREALLSGLVRYNEDDLFAMRAIWRWMLADQPHEP